MVKSRSLGAPGAALIKKWEGCHKRRADGKYQAYPDPGSKNGKPWTIGWGSTGPDIVPGLVWTRAQCDARFDRDIVRYVTDVDAFLGAAPTSQSQFDALVSFHYNTGAIGSSTLGRLHKAGRFDDAVEQFGRWIKNDGKVMQGLINRRAEEAKLYESAAPICIKQPVPAAPGDVRVVNAGSGLNVRATPSAAGARIGGLTRGAAVTVLEDIGDWVRFTYQGRDAWVNDQYLTAA